MPTSHRSLSFFIAAALLLNAMPLSAQDISNEPPAATIMVEQTSDLDAVGKWTLLLPNQESFNRTDATLNVSNLLPGKYTFLTIPPKGTQAHISVTLGDEEVTTSDTPQISFELLDKMTLTLRVHYTLTIFGKLGVNSIPSGVPFTLRGPDNLVKKGVTPMEYSPMPMGNYSVAYTPGGCLAPSQQSGLLQKDDRIDFKVEIVCESFIPVETPDKATHVITTFGGRTTTFKDVPADAWFAPYISTITDRGIMTGYTDAKGIVLGKFGPGDAVTVAQLAKIAHSIMKLDEHEVKTAPINKNARGQWFTPYIASAEDRGWVVFLDGTVDPNRPATRGEVVVTLLQIFDIPAQWGKGNVFRDVLRKTPYSGAIETAMDEGIVSGANDANGDPTGLFHPSEHITRAEIAKILIAVYEKYLADKNDL
ncbi:S-layer homology domain-containing protein [Candidatus Peribacteria bacterium]|nr:S-layer homology domain-containing protein [Candidatus Peribacteria bacterium]